MARYSILIDIAKCNGCYNCFLACRDEYYGNDYLPYSAAQPLNGQFWMQVREVERGVYPKPKVSYIPTPCMHCETAPCMSAAQDGAVYRRDDGIVMIDPQRAHGQKEIVNACPYRVIYWNEDIRIPQKCTMCAHRLDEGEPLPRCVESCPTGALVFGDLDDPQSEISRLSAELQTESLHPEFKTGASVRYVGIPRRFVTGEIVFSDNEGECAPGVKVRLTGEGQDRETVTDIFGDFEFEGLDKNGTYVVSVEADGYEPVEIEFTMFSDINFGEIELDPK